MAGLLSGTIVASTSCAAGVAAATQCVEIVSRISSSTHSHTMSAAFSLFHSPPLRKSACLSTELSVMLVAWTLRRGGPRGVRNCFHQGEEDAMSMRGVFAATLVVGALAAWPMSAARAETEADREACTPEVHRLCGQYIPDRERIIACLKHNMKFLVPACRKVMSRPYRPG